MTKGFDRRYRDRDWLSIQYARLKSTRAVGRLCGVTKFPIRMWLRRHGIQLLGRGGARFRHEPIP